MQLTYNTKFVRVLNAQAAGTGDTLTSSSVDTIGFSGFRAIAAFGTITATAVTTFKLQDSDDDSSYNDVSGSSISVADTDDNKCVISDVYRPLKRYVKVLITRATANAVVDGVFIELYEPRKAPITKDSTIATQELWVSPSDGTA